MNDFWEIIRKRTSVRQFEQRPVARETLEKIIEAGRCAPSGGNNQTTHLLVIENQDVLDELRILVQQELSLLKLDEHTYKSLRNSITASKTGTYCFDYHAAALVIAANRIDYGNAMADSSCVLENMMLAATALDIGVCWVNQIYWLNENQVIRKKLSLLGLAEFEKVCGSLALGYAADTRNQLESMRRRGNPVTYIR